MKKFILLLFLVTLNLWGQNRGDFFDPFDYNLRNYEGKSGFDVDEKEFKEYTLPPKSQTPNSLTTPKTQISPKNVEIPTGISTLLVNPISRSGTRRKVSPNITNPAVNPITGEVDTEAILKAEQEKRKKKEELKKLKKNRKIKPYKETKFRRMQIVFFLTLPFSGAISYGLVTAYGEYLNSVRNRNLPNFYPATSRRFQNSFEGGLLTLAGAVTLAALNVYRDMQKVEKYESDKAKQKVLLERLTPNNDEYYIHALSKDYKFSFTFGTKYF